MPEFVYLFLGLVFIIGVVLVIPPRWDPAIRLKEWNERRSK
jgi:hypothetical protein